MPEKVDLENEMNQEDKRVGITVSLRWIFCFAIWQIDITSITKNLPSFKIKTIHSIQGTGNHSYYFVFSRLPKKIRDGIISEIECNDETFKQ